MESRLVSRRLCLLLGCLLICMLSFVGGEGSTEVTKSAENSDAATASTMETTTSGSRETLPVLVNVLVMALSAVIVHFF